MRGALGKLEGISNVDIKVDVKEFSVSYEKDKVDPTKILAALEAAGEPAKKL